MFLALISLALGATLAFMAVLVFAPQRLPLPQSLIRHSSGPRAEAPLKKTHHKPAAPSQAARTDLPFEEHLPAQEPSAQGNGNGPEIRRKVEQLPPPAAVVEPAPEPSAPTTAPPPATGREPMMVIVIDDLGDHPVLAKNLTELPFPVTMAILPNRPRTRYVAGLAADRGLEIILHQPMQPGTYPRVNPGPGAVFTDMAADRIKAQVAANLEQLPHVAGLNNHMGSAFTSSAPGMEAVMEVLKAKGLFFLDSVTSAVSAAPDAARKAGVPLYRRSVFLDNIRNVRLILAQLKVAENLAIKHGRAIAIGHPYGETLQALRIWGQEHDQHVKLVTLGDLGPEPTR